MARVRYVYTFPPSLDQSRLINGRYPIFAGSHWKYGETGMYGLKN